MQRQRSGGFWHSLTVAALIATGAGGAGCTHEISDKDIKGIGLEDVRRLASSSKEHEALLVDPRAPSDYAVEHIAGARNVALNEVMARYGNVMSPELEAYRNLIVYGNNPGSDIAIAMSKRLMEAGHDRVWLFWGGLIEWKRAGLKTDGSAVSKPERRSASDGEGELAALRERAATVGGRGPWR